MTVRPVPLAEISTQYARNGPLLAESIEFTRLMLRGLTRDERKRLLVTENRLARETYKSRRNIFEALEARFTDHRRAAHLGLLTFSAASFRSFSVGCLLELAKHDLLIDAFLKFVIDGASRPGASIDAALFLQEMELRYEAVRHWAPSLRRRAVSALNALPGKFQLWDSLPASIGWKLDFPLELAAIIVHEHLEVARSPVTAPDFEMLGLSRQAVLDVLWRCARREWFKVDIVADVVYVEPLYPSLEALLGVALPQVTSA